MSEARGARRRRLRGPVRVPGRAQLWTALVLAYFAIGLAWAAYSFLTGGTDPRWDDMAADYDDDVRP